jgi:hypothetical protein
MAIGKYKYVSEWLLDHPRESSLLDKLCKDGTICPYKTFKAQQKEIQETGDIKFYY